MAGTNASEIRTAANGNIYVAPVGTTEPTTAAASLAAGWIDIGFTSEDGVKFKDGKESRDQTVWQSFYPVGKKITGRSAMAEYVMKQWNKFNVSLAFGGTTTTTVSAGQYKIEPPDPEDVDYRAMIIEWTESTYIYRLVIPRGLVTDDVETMLKRDEDSELPIMFEATPATAAAKPWYILSNDAAYA